MYYPYEFDENSTPVFGTQPAQEPVEGSEPQPQIDSPAFESQQPQISDQAPQPEAAAQPIPNENYTWQPMYAVPVYTAPRKAPKAPKPPRKKKEGRLGARIVALALCCSLLGGALGAGAMAIFGKRSGAFSTEAQKVSQIVEGKREASIVTVAEIDTSKLMTPAEVYAANVNSTVGITTSVTTNYWGYQTTAAASGSGFIISDDGYILTNYHVVEDANSVTVTLYDDTTYDAELIGYDESNDIAILKVDGTGLTPVILGDSEKLQVGESVVAIGNPLGELTFSLTAGTVSALDRRITMSNGLSMELIQTDCAINSGNSGGALLNLHGEVIGITNAKYSGSGSGASIDNIGFAIPINAVRDIVKSIIEKGYISKPYIGIGVDDVSQDLQAYGLPKGAVVRSVTEDGPAARAGLKVNDIITAVNGTEISSGDEMVKAVGNVAIGDELKLTVVRQIETVEITVTVEEKIQQAKADEEESSSETAPQMPQQVQPFGGMDPFSFFFGY